MARLFEPHEEAYRTYWSGKAFPLTRDSIQKASAPYGHMGALLRLQAAASKLLGMQPLDICVLGGSVTTGYQSTTTWSQRLGEMFTDLGYSVKVTNLAHRATTSKWAVGHFGGPMRNRLSQADLVIVDYTVNDDRDPFYRYDMGSYDTAGAAEAAKYYKELMALLLNLPRRPAVLASETVFMHRSEPTCDNLDVRNFVHWGVEEELRIPVVSYPTAVCPSGSLQWFNDQDEFAIHPGHITHDLIARTILGSLLLQTESVCDHGLAGADHPAVSAHATTVCLAKPVTRFTVAAGRLEFLPVARDVAWTFQEDVPGKPGWIASASAPPGEIAFHVDTKVGWIQVEYLGTYTDIGEVSVWLDSEDEATCVLNGLWTDRSSQSRFSLMRSGLPPGNHTLRFRSKGAKFKLLGIVTC